MHGQGSAGSGRDDVAVVNPRSLELIKAILVLPGTALVYVPAAILWFVADSPSAVASAGLSQARFWIGLLLGAVGLAIAVWTVRLFWYSGEGTPAPWAPPKHLVVLGPYRYVRNPMITSVLLLLGSESLLLGSWHLAGWMLLFFLGAALVFPWVEEPALERRFGDDYRRYKANVPRWIPRTRTDSNPLSARVAMGGEPEPGVRARSRQSM